MSSSNYSNDTAIQLQVLRGQDNHIQWVRDFKPVANSEGVWGFYEGTEEILVKPDRDDCQIPKAKRKTKDDD